MDRGRRLVRASDALVSAGRFAEAVDVLTAANRAQFDDHVDQRLVELRCRAFRERCRVDADRGRRPRSGCAPVAGTVRDGECLWPDRDGLRSIEPDRLSAEAIDAAIAAQGCLSVRGLVPAAMSDELVDCIDRAFAAHDQHKGRPPPAGKERWFRPLDRRREGMHVRRWTRNGGGVLGADSPRVLARVIDVLEEAGLRPVLDRALGGRPGLLADKCTLRRAPVEGTTLWHQDGAFLGAGVRALNVWVALTDCGVDAPGLEVLPNRLDAIVETGGRGGKFDWATSPRGVERVVDPARVCRPRFDAGDALIFDDRFLHRTWREPDMARERYALECWFVAPSAALVDRPTLLF